MLRVRHPITAPFENFDFVVEALNETARLAAGEVVRDLIHPILKGRRKTVKTLEPAPVDTLHPTSDRRSLSISYCDRSRRWPSVSHTDHISGNVLL